MLTETTSQDQHFCATLDLYSLGGGKVYFPGEDFEITSPPKITFFFFFALCHAL